MTWTISSYCNFLDSLSTKKTENTKRDVNVNTDVASSDAKAILQKLKVKVHFIDTSENVPLAIERLSTQNKVLGCDIETTPLQEWKHLEKAGLDPHLALIRTIQFATTTDVFVFDVQKIPLSSFGSLWKKPMVFHNASFDVKFLLKNGQHPLRVGCTQLMDLMLRGGGSWKSLVELSEEYLKLKIQKEQQSSDWSKPNLSQEQIAYAALDAVLVRLICDLQLEKLRERKMTRIGSIIQKAIPAVASMELSGIPFDWSAHLLQIEEWERDVTSLATFIKTSLRIDDMSSMKEIQQKFSVYFKKQNLDIPKGKNGLPKLGKQELARFKNDPLIVKYLEYSCLKTRLSTFGDRLRERANPVTDRVHPMFLHGRASTGRFATSNPNTQNFPNGAFRNLIKPKEGRVFVVADYSQIELRLIAIVSREENMLASYREGKDLHRLTASKILNIHPDQVTKEQRTCAKAVNFGFIYGQREGGFIRVAENDYGLKITFEEAKKYRDAFFQAYPAIARWHREIAQLIQKTGKVKTLNGWERDFNREVEKIIAQKERVHQRKMEQKDRQKVKIQCEEQVLERHRERIAKDPDNPRTKELFYKKEVYVAELKKKYRLIEQECRLLNGRISNAKKERNILMVPRILEEKSNILFGAYNLPIQGLGCELMAVALTKVYLGLVGTTASIINCIHDELVIECDLREAEDVSRSMTQAMQEAFSEMFPDHIDTLTRLVETTIAQNWGEAK